MSVKWSNKLTKSGGHLVFMKLKFWNAIPLILVHRPLLLSCVTLSKSLLSVSGFIVCVMTELKYNKWLLRSLRLYVIFMPPEIDGRDIRSCPSICMHPYNETRRTPSSTSPLQPRAPSASPTSSPLTFLTGFRSLISQDRSLMYIFPLVFS